jgi:hypothetical protein
MRFIWSNCYISETIPLVLKGFCLMKCFECLFVKKKEGDLQLLLNIWIFLSFILCVFWKLCFFLVLDWTTYQFYQEIMFFVTIFTWLITIIGLELWSPSFLPMSIHSLYFYLISKFILIISIYVYFNPFLSISKW